MDVSGTQVTHTHDDLQGAQKNEPFIYRHGPTMKSQKILIESRLKLSAHLK